MGRGTFCTIVNCLSICQVLPQVTSIVYHSYRFLEVVTIVGGVGGGLAAQGGQAQPLGQHHPLRGRDTVGLAGDRGGGREAVAEAGRGGRDRGRARVDHQLSTGHCVSDTDTCGHNAISLSSAQSSSFLSKHFDPEIECGT